MVLCDFVPLSVSLSVAGIVRQVEGLSSTDIVLPWIDKEGKAITLEHVRTCWSTLEMVNARDPE